jgi:hypothetical protein
MYEARHWSFKLADPSAALPVGIEHFEFAVQCLRPMTLAHQQIDREFRFCACAKCAGDAIQKLAFDYNTNRLLNAGAPRAKDVLNRIEMVRLAAAELLKVLFELDDYSRKAFHDFYGNYHSLDIPLYAGYFDKDELSDSESELYSDLDAELIKAISEVRDAARIVSVKYKQSRKGHQQPFADRGGNTNLFKEEHGSPDHNLVRDGWTIFERFQPGKARGTENGAFHEFLKHVFGYATGQDPENYSGLSVGVKLLAVPLRQRQEIINQGIAVEREMNALEIMNPDQVSAADELSRQRKIAQEEVERIERALRQVRSGKKASPL